MLSVQQELTAGSAWRTMRLMLTLIAPIIWTALTVAVALLALAAAGVALDRRLEGAAEQAWTAWHPGAIRPAPGRHRAATAPTERRTDSAGPVVIAGLDTWDADTERIVLYPVG